MKLAWDSKRRVDRSDKAYFRERSAGLYHTSRWTKLAKAFKASHPLCVECQKKGIIRPSEVADHIVPWPVCGQAGFFDESNLQALCSQCNNEKGQRDKSVIGRWRSSQSAEGVGGLNLSKATR